MIKYIPPKKQKFPVSGFKSDTEPAEPMPKILLVDMNSFFASVEQQANPKLRGMPLGVCASLHETSCLIATSREAKQLGIKTGTLVYKAKRICPKIKLLHSDPDKYREVNRRLNKIFFDYTERVECYSIDESFLDLKETSLNPLQVGAEIKRRILDEVGEWLTCSVGIGANKFLAKLAADLKKPDGLSIVWRSNLRQVYCNKKLSELWGVARGWERRLARLGILNPLQVLDYPLQNLISVYGKPGFYLWQRINGLEQDEVKSFEDDPKSFGHSWVLNFRTTDKERLKPVILRLAEKAARRMRAGGFKAYGVYLSVTLTDGTHLGRSKKFKFAVDRGYDVYEQALILWKNWKLHAEVLHIAVGFTNLSLRTLQLPLFKDTGFNLTNTLDEINDKYGEFAIRSGLLTKTSDFAPDSIAFGK